MLRGRPFVCAMFRLFVLGACFVCLPVSSAIAQNAPLDYSADSMTDLAIVRNQAGAYRWWIADGLTGAMTTHIWGISGDAPLGGDYDGDGRADVAIWRPGAAGSAGQWILRSSDSGVTFIPLGQTGDIPVPGDYDGDGKTDAAVYRNGLILGLGPSSWIYVRSSDGVLVNGIWGVGGDTPAPGDYDGDGRCDMAVFRDLGNTRAYLLNQTTEGPVTVNFGDVGDIFVPGDYDGDGRTDLAVAQSEGGILTWWIRRSSDTAIVGYAWGVQTDRVVHGDYDGDGRTDIAVWRPSSGQYFVLGSTNGYFVRYWGKAGDVPLSTVINN